MRSWTRLSNLSDQSDDSNHKIIIRFILNEAEESPDNSISSSLSATLAKNSKRRKKTADVNRNLFNERGCLVYRNSDAD